ncbi:MAG: hypothetical protein COT73_04355 [Bdellovibrio sp. CG10_big_fil_rev_8_21_14_0_10_47_8]|nr:MAG: hypothetical protein COT73_04355 [Bdellovibrio sp. CG10_big_fil_rev_8_21_14_0_10_47_8]
MISSIIIRLASFNFQRALVFSVIAGVIYYFFGFNDGSSIQVNIDKVQKDIQVEESKAKEADAALKEVEQVRAAVGALSDQFRMVSQAIPTDLQMADIIRAVDTTARVSGLSMKSKEPRPVVNYSFYEEIPLQVTMEGNYSQVAMFLYHLASLERIMRVKTFTIQTPPATKKNSGHTLTFLGQIVSYRFIGETPPVTTKGKKR